MTCVKRGLTSMHDGSSPEPGPRKKKQLRRHTCLVCDVEKGVNQFPSAKRVSSHDHESNTCRPCYLKHVETEIDSKAWDQVACPECPIILTFHEVKKMTDSEHFEKYEQNSLRSALAEDEDYRHCFSTTCDAGQLHTGGADEPIFRCQACDHKHCVACEANWHQDETCDQYQQRRRERGEEDAQSNATVADISKPCPVCHTAIEKISGCDHMTCSRCHHQFCWICFFDYTELHRIGNSAHDETCLHWRPPPTAKELQEVREFRVEEAREIQARRGRRQLRIQERARRAEMKTKKQKKMRT